MSTDLHWKTAGKLPVKSI